MTDPLGEAPGPSGARCSRHPERAAAATCTRCGVFICREDRRELDRRAYCEPCVAHPEVDYLEAFRLRFWGKRDVWGWLSGIGGASYVLLAVTLLLAAFRSPRGDRPLAIAVSLALALMAAQGIGLFLGLRWARYTLMVWPVLGIGFSLATGRVESLPGSAVALLIALAIVSDTRNQLFFKVPVSRKQLERMWNLHCKNRIARLGFILSVLSLPFGPAALISLPMSIVGLRRVDLRATPPIGRKGLAIAGILLSSLAVVGWSALLVASQLD